MPVVREAQVGELHTSDVSSVPVSELLRGLSSPPSTRLPLTYRMASTVAAVVLVVLWLAYFALMASAVWFALDYLVGHVRLLLEGASFLAVAGYLLLGMLVLTMALLLVKPALHMSGKEFTPVELDPKEQHVLYDYVQRLSTLLDTPMPTRILVIPGPQAYAKVGGLRGLFNGELELVLGLTLAGGMSLQAFSGIIAHELGHFAFHRGWRVMLIVRSINAWFARAIYERDKFDLRLARLSRIPVVGVVFRMAGAAVRLGRLMLKVFMWTGHLASCMVARRAEYECDQFTARIVGSSMVATALQRTVVLSLAERTTLDDLAGSYREHRLADDLPMLVESKADRMPADAQKRFLDMLRAEKTGYLDTHPSILDRAAAAERTSCPAMITDARPARRLFVGFHRLCQSATISLYRHILKENFAKAKIVPAETLICEFIEVEQARRALRRYYQGDVLMIRPIFPRMDADHATSDIHATMESLVQTRQSVLVNQKRLLECQKAFVNAQEVSYQLYEIHCLLCMGLQLRPRPDLGLQVVSSNNVLRQRNSADQWRNQTLVDLEPLEQQVRRRMMLAIMLLESQQFRDYAAVDPTVTQGPEEFVYAAIQVRRVIQAGSELDGLLPTLRNLWMDYRVLTGSLQTFDLTKLSRSARSIVQERARACHEGLARLGQLQQPYPFEHSEAYITVGGYLV